jgi:hypothetical protein
MDEERWNVYKCEIRIWKKKIDLTSKAFEKSDNYKMIAIWKSRQRRHDQDRKDRKLKAFERDIVGCNGCYSNALD